jgi:hypothetical protein
MPPLLNKQKEASVTPTLQIVGAYDANDVMGGLLTFDVANSGGGGLVRYIRVADDDDEKAVLTLYLFNAKPTVIADGAAFAPAIADLKKLVGIQAIAAADYTELNSNACALYTGDTAPNFSFTSASGNLFGYLVCTATPTYTAATDLTISLGCWLDG